MGIDVVAVFLSSFIVTLGGKTMGYKVASAVAVCLSALIAFWAGANQ